MKRELAERLESLADGLASGGFGAAVGLLVYHLPAPVALAPMHGGFVAGAALIAFVISRGLLGLVARHSPSVRAARVEQSDAFVSGPTSARERGEDRGSASGIVVQLFDPAAETEYGGPARDMAANPSGDATQSLHEALSQLRQSLANRR